MAFRLPDFNLTCNIKTRAGGTGGPNRVVVACQLRAPQHITSGQADQVAAITAPLMMLSLPPLTDIRDPWSAPAVNNNDIVEVPAGSGRFYDVCYVDDVAKGFPNEYRFAFIYKHYLTPVPLP